MKARISSNENSNQQLFKALYFRKLRQCISSQWREESISEMAYVGEKKTEEAALAKPAAARWRLLLKINHIKAAKKRKGSLAGGGSVSEYELAIGGSQAAVAKSAGKGDEA